MSVAIILASCKETETIVTIYNGIGMRDTEEITWSWQRAVAPVGNREFTEQEITRGSTEIARGSSQLFCVEEIKYPIERHQTPNINRYMVS